MKKSSLFISAAITTFILAVLAGVIFYARTSALSAPIATLTPTNANTQAPTDTLAPTDTATLAPTATSGFVSPQEAAFIAGTALGDSKIFSVDTVTRYGMDSYKVTFSSGNVVFVAPDGHIMVITNLATINGVSAPTQPPSADSGSSSSSSSHSGSGSGGSGGGDDHGGSGGDD
jgi:uncharacterized membrane protein YgcG